MGPKGERISSFDIGSVLHRQTHKTPRHTHITQCFHIITKKKMAARRGTLRIWLGRLISAVSLPLFGSTFLPIAHRRHCKEHSGIQRREISKQRLSAS
jgi:hypothetical protein